MAATQQVNEQLVLSLMCSARNRFNDLVGQIEKMGYSVTITSANRSMEEQMKLYKDLKGKKAGRAGKPSSSFHPKGAAIDLNLSKNGKFWKKSTSRQEWLDTKVPDMAKHLGFRWGGDFLGNYDPVHFDLGRDFKINKLTKQIQYMYDVPLSTQLYCAVEDFAKKFLY